ncbi:MAG: hypothetical protein U9O66_01805 [Patescibacteria group bacterium]|nr:hypothetical protein [Patescibacteria group bacterium]
MTDSPKLSKKASEIFDLADCGKAIIIISAVVLLESIDILDKKKIKFQFNKIISMIIQADNFIFSQIDLSLILEINSIKGFNDIHDRVIVATANLFNTHLITKDKIIKQQYSKTIW